MYCYLDKMVLLFLVLSLVLFLVSYARESSEVWRAPQSSSREKDSQADLFQKLIMTEKNTLIVTTQHGGQIVLFFGTDTLLVTIYPTLNHISMYPTRMDGCD